MDMTTLAVYAEVKTTPIEGRRWLGMNLTDAERWDVYITTRSPWQEGHAHEFEMPDPEGSSSCTGCGAAAWSLTWVTPAIKCDDECKAGKAHLPAHLQPLHDRDRVSCKSGAWVKSMLARLDDLVDQSAQYVLERELGAVCVDGPGVIPTEDRVPVVLAALDPSERTRPGIPVPPMKRGVLS